MKLISVYITEEIAKAKKQTDTTWRGLIIRGLNSRKTTNTIKELEEKINKMATKIQEYATKVYKLENAQQKQ